MQVFSVNEDVFIKPNHNALNPFDLTEIISILKSLMVPLRAIAASFCAGAFSLFEAVWLRDFWGLRR